MAAAAAATAAEDIHNRHHRPEGPRRTHHSLPEAGRYSLREGDCCNLLEGDCCSLEGDYCSRLAGGCCYSCSRDNIHLVGDRILRVGPEAGEGRWVGSRLRVVAPTTTDVSMSLRGDLL